MNHKINFKLTIITPTYNRANLLRRIFNSLQGQEEYIAEWVIIDDGSKDQTDDLIQNFKKESPFKIVYEYSINRGMTHAINLGLKYVNGDYFMKLDSDDYLVDNSFEIIYKAINKIRNSSYNNKINCFSFLTSQTDGKIINKFNGLKSIGNNFEEKIICLDYLSARYMNLITGDLLDVFESYPLLDHFRYPVFKDETHSPSGFISYFNADYFQGKVAFVLENVLIKEYQSDGISSKRKKYGLYVPNNNLKGYLLSHLWLINSASYKIKHLYMISKQIFKLSTLLFLSLIGKFIRLILKKYY